VGVLRGVLSAAVATRRSPVDCMGLDASGVPEPRRRFDGGWERALRRPRTRLRGSRRRSSGAHARTSGAARPRRDALYWETRLPGSGDHRPPTGSGVGVEQAATQDADRRRRRFIGGQLTGGAMAAAWRGLAVAGLAVTDPGMGQL